VKLGAEVTFTPDGEGEPTIEDAKLKLVRKK
jgi:hypothetical protein